MGADVPAVPRPAAAVILVRDEATALEVLLVERAPSLRFAAGAWVFPGGRIEPGDGDGDRGRRVGALRELAEETGIEGIDADDLIAFSRWITPASSPIRFDTHFFVAPAPDDAQVRLDGTECLDAAWWTPRAALRGHDDGRLVLLRPTVSQLEQVAAFESSASLLAHAGAHELAPGGAGSPEASRLPPAHGTSR